MLDETAVHILGGGIGGTLGAVITCPLEVIKVRLQSSQGAVIRAGLQSNCYANCERNRTNSFRHPVFTIGLKTKDRSPVTASSQWSTSEACKCALSSSTVYARCTQNRLLVEEPRNFTTKQRGFARFTLIRCLSDVSRNEGLSALFKGLVPTLVGVLPSRGIYFCAYHKGQLFFENHFPSGSSGVYLCAAGVGSITASSLTNPIWFVKTRLQLDSRPGLAPITVSQVIRTTWHQDGIRGFYRGVSASYVGSLETALNFMIYENVKSRLLCWELERRRLLHSNRSTAPTAVVSQDLRGSSGGSKLQASRDMVLCMLASACSKAIAITLTYPHEVVRTRLRESTGDYRGFIRTLTRIAREEGCSGWYRGMGTHYIRQVPNSCIMIGTYELVVFLLQSWGLTNNP